MPIRQDIHIGLRGGYATAVGKDGSIHQDSSWDTPSLLTPVVSHHGWSYSGSTREQDIRPSRLSNSLRQTESHLPFMWCYLTVWIVKYAVPF